MPYNLNINDELISQKGKKIKILKMIDDNGGQGIVYLVDYDGEQKILKWYKRVYLEQLKRHLPLRYDANGRQKHAADPKQPNERTVSLEKAFYDNLCKNAFSRNGDLSPRFIWPQDVTPWSPEDDGSFGYIMERIPTDIYTKFEKYLVFKKDFPSREIRLTACLNIVKEFENLHNAGYSYQDINAGNIYIRSDTGDILIADTDNISVNGLNFGMGGTDGFKAPEIWLGGIPDTSSDLFSLAIVLFRIMMGGVHPFEGKYSKCNEAFISQGKDPVFIFDRKDKRNAPQADMHRNAMISWPQYPAYIHELFQKAFSHDTVHDTEARPLEINWIRSLIRLRGEIAECPLCGAPLFASAGEQVECLCCEEEVTATTGRISFGRQTIPLTENKTVYECQINGSCREFDRPLLKLITEDTDEGYQYRLVNLSPRDTWTVTYPNGVKRSVKGGQKADFVSGMSLRIGRKTGIVSG